MRTYLSMAVFMAVALFAPVGYRLFFDYQASFIYPSLLSHTLLLAPIAVLFTLKNRFTKVFLLVWIAWLFIGEIKILDYYSINPFYIAMDEGVYIYNLFLIALSLGMLAHDLQQTTVPMHEQERRKGWLLYNDLKWLEYPLMAFPVLWFIDFIRSVGYIPIFSGHDVTDRMYQIDYGVLYSYGFVNCVSAVLLYDRFLYSSRRVEKSLWLVAVVLVLLVMSIDSKRLFLLMSIGAIFIYDKIRTGRLTIDAKSMTMAGAGVVLYVILQLLRLGNTSISTFKTPEGFPMGVEFREYIRAVNEYEPGKIPGYDFAGSTLANLFNSALLGLVGINKSELVTKDSALSFMTLFERDNTLGIRTGLISELYFAYDFYGLIGIFLFGYGISWLAYTILQTRLKSNLILLIVIFALFILTVFGQSSVTAGCLCILLYLHIVIRIARPAIRPVVRVLPPTTSDSQLQPTDDLHRYPGL
jgi:hypothetical protein